MPKINIKADFRDHDYLSVKLTKARRIKKKLSEPLPWIEGTLNTAYLEVAEALIWELPHAMISLSGGLCEHFFRLCLYEKNTASNKSGKIHDELWETLNGKDLTELLVDAKKRKDIIPKEDHKWWFEFSKEIRNPYIHFRVYDIVKGKTRLVIDGAGEERNLPVQPYMDEWAICKKYDDKEKAVALFTELTKKVLKIFSRMQWTDREPEHGGDSYLHDQYKKFFSDNFSSCVPIFINIPDDYWVDY